MKRATLPRLTALQQIGTALWLALVIALGLLLLTNLAAGLFFGNRVLPGVSTSGISLAGLNLNQAAGVINTASNYPESGRITLTFGGRSWVVRPVDLGVFLDPQATATAAFSAGRSGSIQKVLVDRVNLLSGGIEIQPVFVYDESTAVKFLESLASQVNQPIREASLEISGTDVVVNNGQAGRALDIASSLALISHEVALMHDATIPLVVTETQPQILDVSAQGELARSILSQPFTFTLPTASVENTRQWQLDPSSLAKMLNFERVQDGNNGALHLVVNQSLMAGYLESLRDNLDTYPVNARFIFNDDTGQLDLLEPSATGQSLNNAATIDQINASLAGGNHQATLALDFTQPAVNDTATGADLGITELVYAYTSYFRGSSSDRVQNIKIASASFHGLLIPPGGVLSMSNELGDISLDNGYAEAPIILGDETIKGVGGGVCQVSTTLFRTVYFAGYNILERHAHAYRVGYYEQTAGGHDQNLAGLDATVFVPLVDFKFENDTDNWLLMETYVSSSNYSLTWKFYSTKDGREVESHTTGPTNIIDAPDPLYRENPDLNQGVVKQVDYSADGATVVATRRVTRGGVLLYSDTFTTVYQPWRAVYEYGPGTEGMPPPKTPQ